MLPFPSFDTAEVNGVDVSKLDQDMAAINWPTLFDETNIPVVLLEDKKSWALEEQANNIVIRLGQLATTKEGEAVALLLKTKHWAAAGAGITAAGGKNEITQRFYPHPSRQDITLDEAYRFLENKRLEWQFRISGKQKAEDIIGAGGDEQQLSLSSPKNNRAKSRKNRRQDSR